MSTAQGLHLVRSRHSIPRTSHDCYPPSLLVLKRAQLPPVRQLVDEQSSSAYCVITLHCVCLFGLDKSFSFPVHTCPKYTASVLHWICSIHFSPVIMLVCTCRTLCMLLETQCCCKCQSYVPLCLPRYNSLRNMSGSCRPMGPDVQTQAEQHSKCTPPIHSTFKLHDL